MMIALKPLTIVSHFFQVNHVRLGCDAIPRCDIEFVEPRAVFHSKALATLVSSASRHLNETKI